MVKGLTENQKLRALGAIVVGALIIIVGRIGKPLSVDESFNVAQLTVDEINERYGDLSDLVGE